MAGRTIIPADIDKNTYIQGIGPNNHKFNLNGGDCSELPEETKKVRNVSVRVMTRVNSGIHPKHLADQHLVAESAEIPIVIGSLRRSTH